MMATNPVEEENGPARQLAPVEIQIDPDDDEVTVFGVQAEFKSIRKQFLRKVLTTVTMVQSMILGIILIFCVDNRQIATNILVAAALTFLLCFLVGILAHSTSVSLISLLYFLKV